MTVQPLQSAVAAPVGGVRPGAPLAPLAADPADRFVPSAPSAGGATGTAAAAPSDPTWKWGRKGHEIVPAEAANALPEDMPGFFKANADRLTALGSQPDRWRFRELEHLKGANIPDHYMNYEPVAGKELPRDRYAYARMLADQGIGTDGKAPQFNGTLPYRVAEMFETLVAEFALYRMELERRNGQEDSPLLRQLQENALYTAGLLSHYVADATQPLHASIHHDGWNESFEPNPGGFRTRPGIHRDFETLLVNEAVTPEEVRRRIPPVRLYEGDPLQLGLSLIQESNGQVRHLYRLEKEGKLNPQRPHKDGVELATARLARGAQVLRDLWYSAWVRSEALAAQRPGGPEPQGDGYLFAR